MVLYDRNIIGTSSEIFGYLRQSSVIFGKCSENVRNIVHFLKRILQVVDNAVFWENIIFRKRSTQSEF